MKRAPSLRPMHDSGISPRSPRPVTRKPTFQEIRQQQRIKNQAGVGPGHVDGHLKPLGSDIPQMVNMEKHQKYKAVVSRGPTPGKYEVDQADSVVKPTIRRATLRGKPKPEKPLTAANPGPGTYQQTYMSMGSNIARTIDFQKSSPYKFKPKEGPPPGNYEVHDAKVATLQRVRSAIFRGPEGRLKMKSPASPDPGRYDGHLQPFGALTTRVTMGSKYKMVANKVPGPGSYEVESGLKYTKGASPTAAVLKPDTAKKIRKARATSPDPGHYDGHLKPLGDRVLNQVNIEKSRPFEFKADKNPVAGKYEVEKAFAATQPMKRTANMNLTSPRFRHKTAKGPGYQGDINSLASQKRGGISIEKSEPFKFKPDSNPPVGAYEVQEAAKVVSPRVMTINMKPTQAKAKPNRQLEVKKANQAEYEIAKPLGADLKSPMTMGSPYKFKPLNDNPGVGSYDVDQSAKSYLPTTPSTRMVKSGVSSPARHLNMSIRMTPDAYNGHIKPFGSDAKRIVFGGTSSPDRANKNPGPGEYQSELSSASLKGGPYISHLNDFEARNFG